MIPGQSIVLCEGYHDRAFWKGWLKHLGCVDSTQDPMNRPVTRSEFGFQSPDGKFIRLVPCKGRGNILKTARMRLDDRQVEPTLRTLVINVDPDLDYMASGGATGLRVQDVLHQTRMVNAGAAIHADGWIEVDQGATRVWLVRWEANDASQVGIPRQQSLERLVCAAMAAAYPERAEPVQRWLDSRPNPAESGAKEFAWSFMAGWYAAHNCDAFYEIVWADPRLVGALRERLESADAWRVAASLM